MKKLSENFILELFKICMRNKRVFEIAIQHIKYQFLPGEEYKEVWETMFRYYEGSNKLITPGLLSQKFVDEPKVIELIADIKAAHLPDKDSVLEQLEVFVKNRIFLAGYDKLGDLFNEGNKEGAFQHISSIAESLNDFSIKEQYFDKVFEGFDDRHVERGKKRTMGELTKPKIPTGIDPFDDLSRGGPDRGDIVLWLAQSGVGKTKCLRTLGVNAARRGYKVAHIQAEGTRDECLSGYDACWTGQKLFDIEIGKVDSATREKITKASKNVRASGGEIYVESFEQFNTASLADVREIIINLEKNYGKVDIVLLDYFELFDPGDGKKYNPSEERQRRESLASKLKNIAVEFDVVIHTATQASTVDPAKLNNPNFVMTRYDVSEFKGVIRPFSYFVTMNQTDDEKDNNLMRLHFDKVRKYKGGKTYKIYQRYDRERFYDRNKTIRELYQAA